MRLFFFCFPPRTEPSFKHIYQFVEILYLYASSRDIYISDSWSPLKEFAVVFHGTHVNSAIHTQHVYVRFG